MPKLFGELYNCCFNSNWTIKAQITGISIILIFFSIGVISAVFYSSLYFIKDIIIRDTIIIDEKETINEMAYYNFLQSRAFQRLLDFSYNTLNNINQLNHFIEYNNNTLEIQQPLDCIDNLSLNDSFIYQCSLCYKFCNKSAPIDYKSNQNFFKLISLMTQTLPILNLYRQTFFTSTSDEQFFTVFKGGNYTTFTAHIRPWYKNHIAKLVSDPQQFYLSSLYLDWIHKLAVAYTVSLVDLQNNLIGVLGYDLAFDLIPNFIDEHVKMDIVNSTGYFLVTEYYETTLTPLVIYNQSVTGLNQDDWYQMKQFGDDQRIGKGTLTIKNKNTQLLQQVSVYRLTYPEVYIIIYQIDDELIINQKLLLDNLQQIDQVILEYSIYFSIIFIIFIIFLQLIIIFYTLRNLNQLLLVTRQQIYITQQLKYQKLYIDQQKGNIIQELCQAYLNLNKNLTGFKQRKSTLCKYLQNLKYPKNYNKHEVQFISQFVNTAKEFEDKIIDFDFSEPREYFWRLHIRNQAHKRKYSKQLIFEKFYSK